MVITITIFAMVIIILSYRPSLSSPMTSQWLAKERVNDDHHDHKQQSRDFLVGKHRGLGKDSLSHDNSWGLVVLQYLLLQPPNKGRLAEEPSFDHNIQPFSGRET